MIIKKNDLAKLNGLVLAGGKSLRMGIPKDKINWHGKEHRYYLADILASFCDEVYISCRQDQLSDFDPNYSVLTDTFKDVGPLGGLLSAFKNSPEKAWLIIACDLPLLDTDSIDFLIKARNPEKMATAYENPFDLLPEPMISIWEPESYPVLLKNLDSGNTSLRKTLIHNDSLIIKPSDPAILLNVNTPEEFAKVQEIIKNKKYRS